MSIHSVPWPSTPLSPFPTDGVRIAHRAISPRSSLGFRPPAVDERLEPTAIFLPDEAHAMTVAPTGAGKLVSCTAPLLLQYPGPMIVVDPKGENAIVTARRRRELGQAVHVVDPFAMTGFEPSGFNPLDLVEPDAPDAADEARAIAETLLPARFDPRDVFWRNRAMYLLTAAILSAVCDHSPGQRNLVTVRDIVHTMAQSSGHRDAAIKSRHPEVTRINDLLGLGSSDTVGGILHYALEGVALLNGEPVRDSVAQSHFDLEDVTDSRPMTIYLVLPPHLLGTHGGLLRLWLSALFTALMRRRSRPARSTLLVLDEAAQLGTFPPLRTAITLLRGYGLQTWSLWQDPSQLLELYPADWRCMVNNCRLVQIFGARGPAAWEQFGALIGADLAKLGVLEPQSMIVQQDGEVMSARRIDYRTDPLLAGHADANPLYEQTVGSLRRPHRSFTGGTQTKPASTGTSVAYLAMKSAAAQSVPRRQKRDPADSG